MKSILIFILLFSAHHISAQELDWVFKPIITDAELICVHPTANALVRVEKDRRFGVKNQNDEIILPIVYKSLDLSIDHQYAYLGRKNKSKSIQHIINMKGDTLDFDEKIIEDHPWMPSIYSVSRLDLFQFVEKFDLSLETFDDEQLLRKYRIKDSKGRIVLDSLSGEETYLPEGYIGIKDYPSIKLYDKTGREVYRDEKSHTVSTNGQGLFAFKNKILNANFEEIFNGGKKKVSLIKGYEQFWLYDRNIGQIEPKEFFELNGDTLFSKTFNRITIVDSDWLMLSSFSQGEIYSLKDKEVIFRIKGHMMTEGAKGLLEVGTDGSGKIGVYNYIERKLVFDTLYKNIEIKHNTIVTYSESSDTDIAHCVAYTIDGARMFRVNNGKIKPQKYAVFFINGPDDVNKIVDNKGETLLELEYKNILSKYDDEWVYARDVRNNKRYYNLKDISKGIIKEYQSVEKLKHKSMCEADIYIISLNDKYGLYSSEDGIIVSCQYDDMKFSTLNLKYYSIEHSEVVTVLKDGKWGAFINPCLGSLGLH